VSKFLIVGLLVGVVVIGAVTFKYRDFLKKPSVDSSSLPSASPLHDDSVSDSSVDSPRVAVLTTNLEIPWSLVFLPDKSILLTERPGRVRLVEGGKLQSEPVLTLGDVRHISEGGLLGITVHPKFAENKFVYVYYTYSGDENTLNRVVRFKYENKKLVERKVILDAIPGAGNHNGGRIKFGPDGNLYIGAGDAQEPSLAQDTKALAGKVLRVTDEGAVPADNPFDNPVYSYGHRNPQGLAWDGSGRLWETEHGNSSQDELNLIKPGTNYGWPDSRGDEVRAGTTGPVVHSGNSNTWAPSGMAFLDDSMYFVGLRGALLIKAKINGDKVSLSENFKGEFGRMRDVVVGPDGLLYVITNNTDGRGRQTDGDDKILVINPKKS